MSNMNKSKKKNSRQKSKSFDWLEYIIEHVGQLIVPVCPKFQANVPEWTGPCDGDGKDDSSSSKFLGKRIWLREDNLSRADETSNTIGKGRSESCKCSNPGSYECYRQHISEEKIKLRNELGKAVYEEWRFDEMGEDVSRSWSSNQQKKFEVFVKTNPGLKGEVFLKSAVELFKGTGKSRRDIVSYYLNVYRPRRIGMLTRSGYEVVDSDEDVEEMNCVKVPSKRSRSQADCGSKNLKPTYLAGRR